MKYIELKIKIPSDGLEEAEYQLTEQGFTSMLIDDPEVAGDILNNPALYKYDYLNEEIIDLAEKASGEAHITLYFGDDEEGRREADRAAAIASECGGKCSISLTGDDSEWLYKWQEYFKPTRVGERIVVKPSWESYEPKPDDLVIEMDPGMAFGSGLHETTSMCIKALEKYMKPGDRVLDVGTGTGILSIAARLLGAKDCLGIDIDDEAVRVGAENVERNGLAGSIGIVKGDLMAGVDYEADIIVANLMADLVMKLSPAAAEQLRPGGIYITSGILDIKEDVVKKAIEEAGFEIKEVLADGEWRAIAARRKA